MIRAASIAILGVLASTSIASGSPRVAADDRDEDSKTKKDDDEQLVLLNATSKLGDRTQVDRVRNVLLSKGLLLRLPDRMEAVLDGRSVQINDLDAIRTAFTKLELQSALDLVEAEETRILKNATAGDPIPSLATLAEWHGLIAAGMEQKDEATKWFRAALRLNPAWTGDKDLTSSKIQLLIKRARKEVSQTGKLRVQADDDSDVMIQVDDGKPRKLDGKLTLSAGYHLVMVSAPGRRTWAEMVDIVPEQTYKLEVTLDKENSTEKAAKLIDATVAAPPGKSRLKKATALSPLTGGATRFLVIEDGNDDKLTLRYYDVDAKKVSKPIELPNATSSNGIARKVIAALDPDNMIEPTSVMIIEKQRSQRWYERWYVWVGVAAVAGGGFLGYQYMTREPTSIRGF